MQETAEEVTLGGSWWDGRASSQRSEQVGTWGLLGRWLLPERPWLLRGVGPGATLLGGWGVERSSRQAKAQDRCRMAGTEVMEGDRG